MKIVIAGGSGLIGLNLIEKLLELGDSVVLLTRNPDKIKNFDVHSSCIKHSGSFEVKEWDTKNQKRLLEIIDNVDAIVNLVGESIAKKRWTAEQKQKILSSRIESTKAIVSVIEQVGVRPKLLINASAVGYYGNVIDGDVTELSPKGNGFLADVCEQWEAEALNAIKFGVRVVLLRTGIVLDRNAEVIKRFIFPFKFFIGGPLGSGKQWLPWIHLKDEINAINFLIRNEKVNGAVNLTAPNPIRMEDFCKSFGKILNRPSWLKIPNFILKLLLGELAESIILQGQKAIPQKLLDAGFKFQYERIEEALKEIFSN